MQSKVKLHTRIAIFFMVMAVVSSVRDNTIAAQTHTIIAIIYINSAAIIEHINNQKKA